MRDTVYVIECIAIGTIFDVFGYVHIVIKALYVIIIWTYFADCSCCYSNNRNHHDICTFASQLAFNLTQNPMSVRS